MFFSLILENAGGDQIDMTTTANQYMTSKTMYLKISFMRVIFLGSTKY